LCYRDIKSNERRSDLADDSRLRIDENKNGMKGAGRGMNAAERGMNGVGRVMKAAGE
jgi:hypothetical protein